MRTIQAATLLLLLFNMAPSIDAQDKAPKVIAWDLTELYPSVDAWNEARVRVLADIEKLREFEGTLGSSDNALYTALLGITEVQRQATRVSMYSSLKADEDLRVSETQERRQQSQTMFSKFSQATSWLAPEVLRVGRETVELFIRQDERLTVYRLALDDILRQAPHTLGDEAEEVLSQFTQSFGSPMSIYQMLANSDIPWPQFKLPDGEEILLNSAGYARARSHADRTVRKTAFNEFWGIWKSYRNSVGQTLNAHLQTQVALAKARNHDSVLAREFSNDNLPTQIYQTLVKEVNKALPTLHRYFRLRQRMLGVDQMHYYDIYPPLVQLDKEFDLETSKDITLKAMEKLGDDWVDQQRQAMSEQWMHVYPQPGKRGGAYQAASAFDVHPYLLLNHNDDYDSLSTFAHEWGHAMHTLYARQEQPIQTAPYSIFIAEIPSTSLELILQEYMVANAANDDERLFYLGYGLENLRGTFFRQTMFAEFELKLYEAVERGEPLTGERISELYGELVRRYHGHDDGVVIVDDLYTNEWMFVPHFYYNMYVYQYATSVTAGTALYEKMLSEGKPGVDTYKNLLRAGGSDYPYNLLKQAGVDLTKPEPYRALVSRMNAILDEMEKILAKRNP
jgi:oligoendopeptidase F